MIAFRIPASRLAGMAAITHALAAFTLAVALIAAALLTLAPPGASAQTAAPAGPTVVAGDGPRGRIIAFVLQAQPSALDEAAITTPIGQVVNPVFGTTTAFNASNDESLTQEREQIVERTKAAFSLAPDTEPLLFRVFDVPVLVVQLAQPLPRQEFAANWQDRRQFPNASAILNEHRAHAIIFALVDPAVTQEQVRAAEAVSAVAAAFATSDNTLGVHWGESDMALPPQSLVQAFAQASEEAGKAQEAGIPVKPAWHRLLTLWINILPADAATFRQTYTADTNSPVPEAVTGDAIGFITKGLVSFVGREIEMIPSGRPAAEQALALVNLLAYLLDQGQVLQHEDTLGFTQERSITSALVDSSRLPGFEQTPILRLRYTVDEAAGTGTAAE